MIRSSLRLTLVLVLAGVGAWAQSARNPQESTAAGRLFGTGERPSRNYAGNSFPRNVLSLSVSQETAYDDNLLMDNRTRLSDMTFTFTGRLAFRQERKRLTFALDYQPDLLLYKSTRGLDVVNHTLQLDAIYQATPRFTLRLRDTTAYRTDVFRPHPRDEFMPGFWSPSSLNNSIYTPLLRTLENSVRFDAIYQQSRQTSFTLFGGFLKRDFVRDSVEGARFADRLQNIQGVNGGLQYLRRLDRNNTVGALYMIHDLKPGDSRARVHSAFFNYARQVSRSTTLEVYGGPQYSRLQTDFRTALFLLGNPFLLTGRVTRTRWHPAVGGMFLKQTDRSVLQISVRRTVSDGSGLLVGATSNNVGEASLRRRLSGPWHLNWSLVLADTSSLDSIYFDSRIRGQSTGFSLERTLTENLTARLGYNFIRQRNSGLTPLVAREIDRNRVSFGVFYQVGKLTLGR